MDTSAKKLGGESRTLVIGIFLLALLARAIYLIGFRDNPFFDFNVPRLDPFYFQKCAEAFAEGDWLARFPMGDNFAPLYKYVVGVFFFVFGNTLLPVWIFQFLTGAFSSVLLFAVTRCIFGRKAALVCALFYALYGPNLCFEGTLLRVSLTQFFAIASCLYALKASQGGKPLHFILLGAFLSLLVQSRPNTLFVVLLIVGFFMLKRQFRNGRKIALLLLSFCLVSAPLFIQAILVHGHFVFFDAGGPKVLYFANLPEYAGYGWKPEFESQWNSPEFSLKSFSDVAGHLAQRFLAAPLDFLLLYLRKIYYFFFNYESTINIDYYYYASHSFLLQWPLSKVSLVFSLAIVGMALSIKKLRSLAVPLLFVLGATLSVIFFYNLARFRLVAVPFYMIFAAHGAVAFFQGLWRKAYWVLGFVPVVGVLLFILRTPFNTQDLDVHNIELPTWRGARFIFKEENLDFDKGEELLLESWNNSARKGYTPNYAFHFFKPLYEKKANYHRVREEYEKAAEAFEQLLLFDYENPTVYFALADAYRRCGRPSHSALPTLQGAALEPKFLARAYLDLAGFFFRERKDRTTAGFFYSKILQVLTPADLEEHPEAPQLVEEFRQKLVKEREGLLKRENEAVHMEAQDPEKAQSLYQEILGIDFGNVDAHLKLSSLFFKHGQLQKARDELLYALSIDPLRINLHRQAAILYQDHLKDPRRALAHLKRYLQLSGNKDGSMQEHLKRLEHRIMTGELTF